jgi:hypothetical protein
VVGANATIMAGLGHFPMSEDYEWFRTYFLPTLDDVLAARGRLVEGGVRQ